MHGATFAVKILFDFRASWADPFSLWLSNESPLLIIGTFASEFVNILRFSLQLFKTSLWVCRNLARKSFCSDFTNFVNLQGWWHSFSKCSKYMQLKPSLPQRHPQRGYCSALATLNPLLIHARKIAFPIYLWDKARVLSKACWERSQDFALNILQTAFRSKKVYMHKSNEIMRTSNLELETRRNQKSNSWMRFCACQKPNGYQN